MFPSNFYQSSQQFNHPTSARPLHQLPKSVHLMLFLLGFAAIRRSKSSNQKLVASHPSMISSMLQDGFHNSLVLQSLQFAHLVEVKEWNVFIWSMKLEFLATPKTGNFDPNTNLRMNSTEDVSRSLREKLRDVFQHHWPHIPTLHFTR